jgi:hypothetical protein
MPTPGLVPQNLRLVSNEPEQGIDGEDVIVQVDEGGPSFDTDDAGNIMRIEHEDGSITISLDGRPVQNAEESEAEKAKEWFRNLVDEIDGDELLRISDDLIRGIEDDLQSRREWVEDRAQGIKLLGLKVEIPGLQGASDGAPVEGMSKVRHPLLLEAVLRFQANARSELLPTDGPVKIRNDAIASTYQQDYLGNALEKDLNHYLTTTASEYYPDTDRMLLMLGFGGSAFKKVYFCPLRNRPVSESVDADDLIVNNAATDLRNAKRITHRVMMTANTVKRLQILGVYRDIDLMTPKAVDPDPAQREKAAQQGVTIDQDNPDDRDREIYECYCDLDIRGFEHKWKGKETGLEIPYRVTIDASSREILSIARNYDEDSADLPEARANFVKYTFVPGMGFYDIGLLHILGNTTNAVTAAWREMLDAGMFANFPGFLMADTGARQNTNIFRVPPGGGALVKTGGMPISQAIMPLPYKEPGPALMNLVTNMAETGARVGGTAEIMVGEGKQDAPVGTTLAMIEQATKVLNAVHKRLHSAQAEEFQLLVRCFREHPESFWQRCKRPTYDWNEQTFVKALNDCELVPQADPNTSSHTQRLMKIMALKQLQAANPGMYDPIAIDTAALKAMGWSNPEQFLAPPAAQSAPPPELIQAQAQMQTAQMKAEAAMMKAQTDAQAAAMRMQVDQARAEADMMRAETDRMAADAGAQIDMLNAETNLMKAQAEAQLAFGELGSKAADRAQKERMNLIDLAQNVAVHPYSAELVAPLVQPALQEISEQEQEERNGGIMPRT